LQLFAVKEKKQLGLSVLQTGLHVSPEKIRTVAVSCQHFLYVVN